MQAYSAKVWKHMLLQFSLSTEFFSCIPSRVFLKSSVLDGGKGRFSIDGGQNGEKERKRCCFKFISISVDTAWEEPRGWGGSNDPFCLSVPPQLPPPPQTITAKKAPATYHTHFLSHTHTHQTHTQTNSKRAGSWQLFLRNHHITFQLQTFTTLFLGNLGEFLWAPQIHRGALVWLLWWVRQMQACCVAQGT